MISVYCNENLVNYSSFCTIGGCVRSRYPMPSPFEGIGSIRLGYQKGKKGDERFSSLILGGKNNMCHASNWQFSTGGIR